MKYEAVNNNIILYQNDFSLDETLDCGQAFRWTKCGDNTYNGYFLDRYLEIEQQDNKFIFKNVTEKEFQTVWSEYFDLNTDYSELKKRFSEDALLAEACKFAGGIRILKQDTCECLFSFIISQNNNIPRIKGIISRLCEHYGHFPNAAELSAETEETLAYLRSGFRAKYILDAASKITSGDIDLKKISLMTYDEAKKQLMSVKGVGPKVADCVLLFGMYRTEACPVDVWIKRILNKFYPEGLPECTRGYEGVAQQYLFHYIRCNSQLLDD